jgi:transposase InsO family protein
MFGLFRREGLAQAGKVEAERWTLPPEEARGPAGPIGEIGATEETRANGEEPESRVDREFLTASEPDTQATSSPDGSAECGQEDEQSACHSKEAEVAAGVSGGDSNLAGLTGTVTQPSEGDDLGEELTGATEASNAFRAGSEGFLPDAVSEIVGPPKLAGPRRKRKGRRLEPPGQATTRQSFTPEKRLLLLDTWRRSGLPAKDFAGLVGVSQTTLYKWKQQFERHGPEGLLDRARRKRRGSRLPELTKRTILMVKESHPEWGCQRISDLLVRGPALAASPSAVAGVLHEAGYELVEEPTRRHPPKVRRFERAKANQLWQTDLFTFVLKRQNRRVYLVGFLDDYSRFVVSYGLHASQSTALVLEVLEAGIACYGPPEEILTDNGPQYVTWRGKSRFTRLLEKRGIRQIVARPKRPQTLGKIERFWGTMWREFLEGAVFLDLEDARVRIGHFIDYYNFQRPHRGIDGLVPADRFFGAGSDVLRTLKERVAAHALELARHGKPKSPFYVTGQVDGQSFSVHAEGQRLILRRAGQQREEIELAGAAADRSQPSGSPAEDRPCDPTPQEPSNTVPEPLCPDGSPNSLAGEPACAPPRAPGESGLDEGALAEDGPLPKESSCHEDLEEGDDATERAGGDEA